MTKKEQLGASLNQEMNLLNNVGVTASANRENRKKRTLIIIKKRISLPVCI